MTIHSTTKLQIHQNGSKQASFLSCTTCHNVVAVIYKIGESNKGAINATLLKHYQTMQKPQIISPKLLSANEKLDRWNKYWLTIKLIQPNV